MLTNICFMEYAQKNYFLQNQIMICDQLLHVKPLFSSNHDIIQFVIRSPIRGFITQCILDIWYRQFNHDIIQYAIRSPIRGFITQCIIDISYRHFNHN